MRPSARRAAWLLGLALAPLAAAFAASCSVVPGSSGGVSSSTSTSTGSGGAGGSGGGTGGAEITGRDVFEALKNDIMDECGACHQLGGAADAPFLAAPDVYASITSWPGIVVPNAPQSILLTHPPDPLHGGGQAPDLSASLHDKLLAWLQKEAMDLPSPDDLDGGFKTYIAPIKPLLKGAFNTIYLDPISADLTNSSITFNAEELGDPPSMLLLTNINVHPVADVTLHVQHPLFTVYPLHMPGDPDPVDSFSGLDAIYALGGDPMLGTGTLILANWAKDARLGLAFEKIEALVSTGVVGTCHDVVKFHDEVAPQMQYCAMNCHGGTLIQAKEAMDLSKLDDPMPEEACAQVRARITPGDPMTSQILIVTDPKQQAVHMYKFAGNNNQYTSFKNAVSPWIVGEQ